MDTNNELNKLMSHLEDLKEERNFVLGSTGVHLSAGVTNKYEKEIKNLEKKIEILRSE